MTRSATQPNSLTKNPPSEAGVDIPLNVLIIEDVTADAELAIATLRAAGFSPTWKQVQNENEYVEHLKPDLDIILSDCGLPQFDLFHALALLKLRGWDIPFIVVSGDIDQDTVIAAIKGGANDYLMKDRLGRLGPAVQRVLEERLLRQQKHQAETGWQESAAKYLELFKNTIVGICYTTKEGRFLSANPAVVQMLGYDSERELIESVTDIAGQLYVNRQRCSEFQWLMETQGFLKAFESELYRKDGRKIWISQSGRTILDRRGRLVSYEIFLEDITQRIQTETQLHKVSRAVEQSPVSIIISDLTGAIEYVNPKCEQVSGYTAAELTGQNPRILQGGDTKPETYRELWNAISSGREWSGDLHNRKKSGELFWEHVAISPIRNTDGEITHFLAIKEDITEQKRLEERFLRAQRMENIGTLASGIAHDLNNILAPITMSIQMLKELYKQPAAAGILDVIQSSAQRGANIVKQVLAFGRGLEGHQIELQPNNIVREVLALVQQTFPKTIQTSSFCDRSLLTILADPTQIHQVLLNFCVNARDAMPEGGRLEILTSNVNIDALSMPEAKPGSYVAIEVTDTGTGIPAEVRAKIFDPFFTTKAIGKGTGLGLSTSFGIVQNHGGFIDVSSTPGKGSRFKVLFPALTAGSLEKELVEDLTMPRGNGELILIIDDEAPIRAITTQTLTTYGYRCMAAANGKEAISLFAENQTQIAAVLTDLMMPVMDGATLIRSLRFMNPALKVIAVSGVLIEDHNESKENQSKLPLPEIKHFLLKPFSTKSLLHLLHEVLHEKLQGQDARGRGG